MSLTHFSVEEETIFIFHIQKFCILRTAYLFISILNSIYISNILLLYLFLSYKVMFHPVPIILL